MEGINQHIREAAKGSRAAQQHIYQKLSPEILGLCRRYLPQQAEAEDAMLRAMYNILTKLDQFRGEASFRTWSRRIATNECLMQLRKKALEWGEFQEPQGANDIGEQHDVDQLMFLIHAMPSGFRAVFNMVAVEGYSHREVAQTLSISESTSKSQLSRARQWLQKNMQHDTT